MNPFIQKVLVAIVFVMAIGFLVYKYVMPKKPKKTKKDCNNDSCGC